MTSNLMKLPEAITLHVAYGCCGAGGSVCDCWCHDPTEGGTNVLVKDMDHPDVKSVLDWMMADGRMDARPYPGKVQWID